MLNAILLNQQENHGASIELDDSVTYGLGMAIPSVEGPNRKLDAPKSGPKEGPKKQGGENAKIKLRSAVQSGSARDELKKSVKPPSIKTMVKAATSPVETAKKDRKSVV